MKKLRNFHTVCYAGNSMSHCLDHYIISKFNFKANLGSGTTHALNWRTFLQLIPNWRTTFTNNHFTKLFSVTVQLSVKFSNFGYSVSLTIHFIFLQFWMRLQFSTNKSEIEKTNIFQSGQKSTEDTNSIKKNPYQYCVETC